MGGLNAGKEGIVVEKVVKKGEKCEEYKIFLGRGKTVNVGRALMTKIKQFDLGKNSLEFLKIHFPDALRAYTGTTKAATDKGSFKPGDTVEIHGLNGAAHLNGKNGVVGAWQAIDKAWVVTPIGEDESVGLKPTNMKLKSRHPLRQELDN